MRKRIFEVIEVAKDNDILSSIYDSIILIAIISSIVPLAFTVHHPMFDIIDIVTVVIFIVDYILRMWTADLKLKKGARSFFLYPFTPMAIIDFISILPFLSLINSGWKLLKVFRLLRCLRIFKALRYSKSTLIFIRVFRKEQEALITIFGIAIFYILISALVVLNVEPDTFGDYFHAVYWATISLTTMGYGDIYPVSVAGQIVTMLSSFIGIAIVAMPAGVITAGFMDELNHKEEE